MEEENNANEIENCTGGSNVPNLHEVSTGTSSKEDEQVIPLGEFLELQDAEMEEVAAVLGAGDDYNCSYDQGYMKRQPLYACLTCTRTCTTELPQSAGICLACSYHCHDGHNLIELYTKRHFRCDCGNKKFGNIACNLNPNKDPINIENEYNQNFSGLYCTCHKPYPDPEETIEDDMIQCIICEDWYHSRHLNSAAVEDFAEMICELCVQKNLFLMSYSGLAVIKVETSKIDEVVNITTIENKKINPENGTNKEGSGEESCEKAEVTSDRCALDVGNTSNASAASSNINSNEEMNADATVQQHKSDKNHTPAASENNTACVKADVDSIVISSVSSIGCTRPAIKIETSPRTLFMKELKWRDALCKCDDCQKLYDEHKVRFLLDMGDPVEVYENKGKENYQIAKKKALEAEQEILKTMPRAPLLNAIAGFNDFKDQLVGYLNQFAEEKKVLTVDDVKQFFSKLNSNKRQKTSETTYFCR